MVEKSELLRSISPGELFVVKQVKKNTVVLETVKEGKHVLTGAESLYLNERDDESGCEYDFGC